MFLLFFAAIILSITLVSMGILAIPTALAAITGVFTNVASDLSPPAMLLAGVFCISAGLALALAVVILFPKQPNLLRKMLR